MEIRNDCINKMLNYKFKSDQDFTTKKETNIQKNGKGIQLSTSMKQHKRWKIEGKMNYEKYRMMRTIFIWNKNEWESILRIIIYIVIV
jgi:hypothetical protein